jgi:predicted dehydrogenase
MGRRHLRAYKALADVGAGRFEVAAVCDPNAAAAVEAAELADDLLGSRPAVFSDHEELVASGAVEAVDVVTAPSAHHLVAVPALASGLHVICEKPLGVTVRACQAIVDAASGRAAVLATAENYRRDGPNRLARAVLEHGLLGEVHLMIETDVGGDDRVVISPWRHRRESGSIALDMGVHYMDVFSYYHGELERVAGSAFVAEPLRVLPPGQQGAPQTEEISPGVMRATGEDSLIALYQAASGVLISLLVPGGASCSAASTVALGR